jgi:GLPGLI family protein
MKNVLTLLAIGFSVLANSQMKEGRVVYERTFQLPTRLFGGDPNIAAQLPKARTDQYELLFGKNQSLWQYLPDASSDGDPNTFASGGMVIRFAGGSNDISFCNFESKTRIDQRELADKNYIVSDSMTQLEWKFTGETKTILNYTAQKATTQRITTRNQMVMENGEMKRQTVPDTLTIVAWFTSNIPVAAGPGIYQGQLPGLILELDENNGRTVYQAVEVSPKVSLNKIKEPKDGKKMTAAEFDKEREKVMEEMRKNMPNGMRMRIQN